MSLGPRIELITTGTELLDTRLNGHVVFIGSALRDTGYRLIRQTSVPDGPELEPILRDTIHRADVVLVTGGLGPTTDDLTRETTAKILGLPLLHDEEIAEHIKAYFAKRDRVAPDYVYRQASVPEGAEVIANPSGTAPGLFMSYAGTQIYLLPGPPRELIPMWNDFVSPRIQGAFPLQQILQHRVIRVAGLGESDVQTRVEKAISTEHLYELGYCAHPGIVDVRLVSESGPLLDEMVNSLENEFAVECFTSQGKSLAESLIQSAQEKKIEVATVESCTGGLAAHRLIQVPGASAVVDRSWVTYSDQAKNECLEVPTALLEKEGAVSAAVAKAMAAGALHHSRADLAISITGVAGPTGGTEEKPVGTVWFGLAKRLENGDIQTEAKRKTLPPDRNTFQDMAATFALNWLRIAVNES